MEYVSVGEAARLWGVTERVVQGYCSQGRIEGAEKVSGTWHIPENARKPSDMRRRDADDDRGRLQREVSLRGASTMTNLMPLMNTAFEPGFALETAQSFEAGPRRDIACAEHAYFTGDAARAVELAEPYLESGSLGSRLSACLICAYANLPLGRIDRAIDALEGARGAVLRASEGEPRLRAAEGFIAQTASVLLHLPAPRLAQDAGKVIPLLPAGLRAFAFYVQAHAMYLAGEHSLSLGIAETALLGMDKTYPIPAIYLHLVAVMDLMARRRADEARAHLLAAWELARPDGLIEPLGEHHGLLGGMLEAAIKPAWPDDFRRIIDITYRFSAGWRRVHNPATGDDVADNLTTTEFAASMLAARGWTNAQIADHLGVSPNTVKTFVSSAMSKLHVRRRQDLARYLLT
ncbi:LuxR C-terminal-related transcriptional regulator [Enorma phocaeensis]|uniref:LuxR C-terminal-related transcriptional regulator n=1 Tax=Enorma phocaeensis TaxID=1871019 RepID=UPI0019589146|nr:LuxR C-terminal-related transcriptional regulator [Enorma phocaeensis]MBM6952143.1 helix-turn-helix transcriptional regulator [Enorma phocaeensis]